MSLGSPPGTFMHTCFKVWRRGNERMMWLDCLPNITCFHRDARHQSLGELCCEQGAYDERAQRESGHHGMEQSPAEQRLPGSQHPAARHPRPGGLPAQALGPPLRGSHPRSCPHNVLHIPHVKHVKPSLISCDQLVFRNCAQCCVCLDSACPLRCVA